MSKRYFIYLCGLLLLVSGLALSCKSGGGTSSTTTSTSTSSGSTTTGTSDNYQVLASSSNPKLVSDSEKLLDPSSGNITIVPEGSSIPGFAALGSAQVTFSDGTTVTTDASGVLQSTQIPQSIKDAAATDATQQPEFIITPPAESNLQPESIPVGVATTSSDTNDVPIGLVVHPEDISIVKGEIRPLFAMRENASGKLIKATNVTWTSSNEAIVKVENAAEKASVGVIKAIGVGTATVTAKILDNSNNDITDTATITVADNASTNVITITGNVTKDGVAPSGAVVVFNMPPPPEASDVKLQPFIGKCTKSVTTCTYTIFINIPPDVPAGSCKDFQPVVVDVPDSTGKVVHYFGNPAKINLCTTDGGKTKSQDFATGNPFFVPVPPPPVEKIIRHAWHEVESTFGPRFSEFGEVIKFATAASGTMMGGPFNGWCYVKEGSTITLTSTPVVNNQCVGFERLVLSKGPESTNTSIVINFTRSIKTEIATSTYSKVEDGKVTDTLDTTGKRLKTEITHNLYRPEISITAPVSSSKFVMTVEVTLGADGKPTSIKETVGEQYFVGLDASKAGTITTSCGTPDALATGCSSFTKTVSFGAFGTTNTLISVPDGTSTRKQKIFDPATGTSKDINVTSAFTATLNGKMGGTATESVTYPNPEGNLVGSISFTINTFDDTFTSRKRATGTLTLPFKKLDGTTESKNFNFIIWIGGSYTLSDGSKILLPPGTLIITFPDNKTAFFPPDFVPVIG